MRCAWCEQTAGWVLLADADLRRHDHPACDEHRAQWQHLHRRAVALPPEPEVDLREPVDLRASEPEVDLREPVDLRAPEPEVDLREPVDLRAPESPVAEPAAGRPLDRPEQERQPRALPGTAPADPPAGA